MKDQADSQTVELFPVQRRRGRPVTGQAKSAAERMKAYRQRKKAGQVGLPSVSDLVPELRSQGKNVTRASVTINAVDPNSLDQLEILLRTVMDENKTLGNMVAQLREQLAQVQHERNEALSLESMRVNYIEELEKELNEVKSQVLKARIEKRNVMKKRKPDDRQR
ncbi:hypothetical protein [Methylocaldum sp.]|uniref:hypothetical protein n=1 Tax=Methylocaldum sp. TaxID=1969727 RepID=UPI002D26D694|nr:hypothetical protein [Methylocaldum sp.]HYE37834.1 hypothetical protein [Methylocaldum sp.]